MTRKELIEENERLNQDNEYYICEIDDLKMKIEELEEKIKELEDR